MLQVQNIKKEYKTGSLVQKALDGVSLSLRDNEFVAILGPSGSGKTTLLNVIGGLDRYDSGELIINGVSTKKYSARDWDSYRNHTVGFVFQSYNLIPHQTILSNVELALTISGISQRERKKRAREALKKVGLGEHMHKKPAQLSGGQMQRVAIARALVNDPDILLADEPTGALDSETSLQVMDLLKEVARDRLVVMVTHNPELAEQYATRIVRLRDGKIIDDSDPFDPNETTEAVHRNMGRAVMSRLTAMNLSFHNLWTKKVRTLLVAFAGSIGIIGIAMILSVSNGVDRFIENVEQDTLKSYPLQITDSTFNLNTIFARDQQEEGEKTGQVREQRMVTNFLSRVSVNDLKSLRDHLESGKTDVYDYVQSIEYGYGITPRIYSVNGEAPRQVNPDRSFEALGFSTTDNMTGMLTTLSSTDSFHAMPAKTELYQPQYDVKAGRWPAAWNECVLVLSPRGAVSDLALYTMGRKDPKELEQLVKAFAEGGEIPEQAEPQTYTYEEFLGISFRLLPAVECYTYDPDYKVWTDRSVDPDFLRSRLEQAEVLTIVGVVQPKKDVNTPTLASGICYPAELQRHLAALAADNPIVKAQLNSPAVDVFTGLPFGEQVDQSTLDMSTLFTLDEQALEEAFRLDEDMELFDPASLDLSGLELDQADLSGMVDPNAFASTLPKLSQQQIASLFQGIRFNMSDDQMQTLFSQLMEGYFSYLQQDPSTDLTRLGTAVSEYLASEDAARRISDGILQALSENNAAAVTPEELTDLLQSVLAGYPDYLAENGLAEGEELPMAYLGQYLRSEAAQAALNQAAASLSQRVQAFTISQAQINAITRSLIEGYTEYAASQALPGPDTLRTSFTDYLSSPEASQLLNNAIASSIDTSEMERRAAVLFAGYSQSLADAMTEAAGQIMSSVSEKLREELTRQMETFSEELGEKLREALQVDPETLAEAFSMNMDPAELRDLMTSLLSKQDNSYAGNLRKLGYAREDTPTSITIYPKDFDGKKAIKAILDDYNQEMTRTGQEDKVITYTDMVDTLMSSVTDIVDAISTVLIAFVAISLLVSSVMIGVITYISVLERRKEIGILRAIGASKRNISQVFNAETFIIGALAGLLGVGITWLLLIPTNRIIARFAGQVQIRAYLPVTSAAILVALSIVLTLLGGFIPAKKAARQDPVAALRSE